METPLVYDDYYTKLHIVDTSSLAAILSLTGLGISYVACVLVAAISVVLLNTAPAVGTLYFHLWLKVSAAITALP